MYEHYDVKFEEVLSLQLIYSIVDHLLPVDDLDSVTLQIYKTASPVKVVKFHTNFCDLKVSTLKKEV